MDELDLLKKDWQKDNANYPKISRNHIFEMIQKKSSSIVKTLFRISIIELALWLLLNMYTLMQSNSMYNNPFLNIITIISTIVIIWFVYLLFKSYKLTSATDTSKQLMERILKTRRIIKYYVIFNIGLLVISSVYAILTEVKTNPNFSQKIENASANHEMIKYYALIIGAILILLLVGGAILLVVYWLIYGVLLKRLHKNYKELKSMSL